MRSSTRRQHHGVGAREGRPWRVGLDPRAAKGVLATIDWRTARRSETSGDYRATRVDGKRYSHIIDRAPVILFLESSR